jgi:hypothetical protein
LRTRSLRVVRHPRTAAFRSSDSCL